MLGKHTIGVYPLLLDETCWFLAADFDKGTWEEDTGAFLDTCHAYGVPAALERSRSGRGGHLWIFFDRPVPAVTARQLGCFLLTRTMDRRHQLGLDSYDRFSPNQDTLPKGGFGNLIALPLQSYPRKLGNSVFLDRILQPYPDQWQYLASLPRLSTRTLDEIVAEAQRTAQVIGVQIGATEEEDKVDPWTLPPSRKMQEQPISGPLPERVEIVRADRVYVAKHDLPSAMLNRLLRLAAFQNPEFYKAQALRLSTADAWFPSETTKTLWPLVRAPKRQALRSCAALSRVDQNYPCGRTRCVMPGPVSLPACQRPLRALVARPLMLKS